MPIKTKIEWADYISNPLKAIHEAGPYPMNGGHTVTKRGHACVRISEGCAHCWASNFNIRLGTGLGYTQPNMDKVQVFLDEAELKRMRTFVPRMPKSGSFKNGRERAVIFPCDMTDLFGEWVKEEWIDRIFFAMHITPHVDWFVLTKRTDRMMNYLADKYNRGKVTFSNIFIGCTVENQKRADERRGAMDAISAMGWKTWVSNEPALTVVNWEGWQFLNGLVCGGESGFLARPMPPRAARGARDFCAEINIPFFFKQWGEYIPLEHLKWVTERTTFTHKPVEFDGEMMVRVGRSLSGNVLDGLRHSRWRGESWMK